VNARIVLLNYIESTVKPELSPACVRDNHTVPPSGVQLNLTSTPRLSITSPSTVGVYYWLGPSIV